MRANKPGEDSQGQPKKDEPGVWRTAAQRAAAVEEKKVSKPVEADGWRTEKQRVAQAQGMRKSFS